MNDKELQEIFDHFEKSISDNDSSISKLTTDSQGDSINDKNNKTIGRLKGEQELEHREKMFEFLQKLLSKSLELVIFMIFSNGVYITFRNIGIIHWGSPNEAIFSDDIIKYAITFLFLEVLGVVTIIVRFLWYPRNK